MDKDKEIKKIIKRYDKIFKTADANTREIAKGLYQEIAYMKVIMNELKEQVLLDGAVIQEMCGNGFVITKEHPAQKQYDKIISNYTRTCRAIDVIIPDAETEIADAFEKMLNEDDNLM